jgi:diaminopropionate ammonia-lyase
MVLEMIEQFEATGTPSNVFVQAGVAGLAAAVAGVLSDYYGKTRPILVAVEPEAAAFLLESNLRLRPAKVEGDLLTAMATLSTGSASAAAWPILERRIDRDSCAAVIGTESGRDESRTSQSVAGTANVRAS